MINSPSSTSAPASASVSAPAPHSAQQSTAPHATGGAKANATHCPVEATISLIGGKYKSLILWKLTSGGVLRFSQLRREVPNATPKMLTQQLRELENDGLVRREVYPVIPPRVEYSLTEFGQSIRPVLEAMYSWGTGHLHRQGLEVNCSMQPFDADNAPATCGCCGTASGS